MIFPLPTEAWWDPQPHCSSASASDQVHVSGPQLCVAGQRREASFTAEGLTRQLQGGGWGRAELL